MPETLAPAVGRPRSRVMALVAFALIVVFGTFALPAWGIAADTRAAGEVTVRQGERITEDLYVSAGTFDFNGQAEGDVSVAAGRATLDGTIRGSVMVAGGRAEIPGDIDGSLRILGGRVEITGTVGGDVVVAAGELELTSSGQIGGNLIVAGGRVDVRGRVGGDITGYIGSASIGGAVNGEIDINTGDLEFANTARVTGPVTYTSRNEADVNEGAQLAQGITQEDQDPWGEGANPLGRASGSLLRTLWALIAGVVLVMIAPRLANELGANGLRLPRSLIVGLIGLVAIPVAAVLLMVTVIGIPAGLIVATLFLIMLYLSQVSAGLAIGQFLLPGRWNDGSRGFHLLAMTLGVLLIGATRFIPLPYVYGLLALVITVWGSGAAVMLFGSFGKRAATT